MPQHSPASQAVASGSLVVRAAIPTGAGEGFCWLWPPGLRLNASYGNGQAMACLMTSDPLAVRSVGHGEASGSGARVRATRPAWNERRMTVQAEQELLHPSVPSLPV